MRMRVCTSAGRRTVRIRAWAKCACAKPLFRLHRRTVVSIRRWIRVSLRRCVCVTLRRRVNAQLAYGVKGSSRRPVETCPRARIGRLVGVLWARAWRCPSLSIRSICSFACPTNAATPRLHPRGWAKGAASQNLCRMHKRTALSICRCYGVSLRLRVNAQTR